MDLAGLFRTHAHGLRIGDQTAVARMLAAAHAADSAKERQLAQYLSDHYQANNIPLHDSVRVTLATRLARGGVEGMDAADRDRLYFLVKDVGIAPLMARVDDVLKTHLYPALARSALFNTAINEWEQWDDGQKLAYGREFAQQFARIAGTPGAEVSTFHAPRDADGFYTAGTCQLLPNGQRCRVRLNTLEGGPFSDHQKFDETMYHELVHTVHHDLAQRAETGNFQGLRPELREAATLLALVTHPDIYARLDSMAAYERYPIEQHAEDHARDFARVLHDPAARYATVERSIQLEEARSLRPSPKPGTGRAP